MPACALLVIDMLKDFARWPGLSERVARVVPRIRELADFARSLGVPVIYANDSHFPNVDREFRLWGPHAVKGTEGAEVLDELRPRPGDFVVEKRRYSAFFETTLDTLLRELGASALVLTGIYTNVCVLHTAADAYYRGYDIVVVRDAVEATSDGEQEWALNYMKKVYGAQVMGLGEAEEFLRARCGSSRG
ncbi:MAG: isochorismatase family cysteine hydrolase [Desulfurococcaceae archaeon]